MSRVTTQPQAHPTSTMGSTTSSTVQVPRDKVAMRAYEKWMKRGCMHGCDVQDWVEAEAEVRAEMMKSSTGTRR